MITRIVQWNNLLKSSFVSFLLSVVYACVPMCILSTLSALNSIENDYYHIVFRMASMHIGTRGKSLNNVYHAPRLPAHAPRFRSEHM